MDPTWVVDMLKSPECVYSKILLGRCIVGGVIVAAAAEKCHREDFRRIFIEPVVRDRGIGQEAMRRICDVPRTSSDGVSARRNSTRRAPTSARRLLEIVKPDGMVPFSGVWERAATGGAAEAVVGRRAVREPRHESEAPRPRRHGGKDAADRRPNR